jgi:hypothetical protein
MTSRRFPPPWSVEDHVDACFIVKAHSGQALTISERRASIDEKADARGSLSARCDFAGGGTTRAAPAFPTEWQGNDKWCPQSATCPTEKSTPVA